MFHIKPVYPVRRFQIFMRTAVCLRSIYLCGECDWNGACSMTSGTARDLLQKIKEQMGQTGSRKGHQNNIRSIIGRNNQWVDFVLCIGNQRHTLITKSREKCSYVRANYILITNITIYDFNTLKSITIL